MLYTIIPEEVIFDDEGQVPAYKQLDLGRFSLLVEPLNWGRARIVQVVSTDPQVFLNPILSPGVLLELGDAVSP